MEVCLLGHDDDQPRHEEVEEDGGHAEHHHDHNQSSLDLVRRLPGIIESLADREVERKYKSLLKDFIEKSVGVLSTRTLILIL